MAVTMRAIKNYKLFDQFHLHDNSFAGLVSTWLHISIVQYNVFYIYVYILNWYISIQTQHVSY
jgi:hypothetical protein